MVEMWHLPDNLVDLNGGKRIAHSMKWRDGKSTLSKYVYNICGGKRMSVDQCVAMFGGYSLPGAMFRYIYFVDKEYRKRLAVKEIPFSEIDRLGVGMYKGVRAGEVQGGGTP